MFGYSPRNIIVIVILLVAATWQYFGRDMPAPTNFTVPAKEAATEAAVVERIKTAATNPQAEFWVTVNGQVIKNLKDDNDGSRHQKFLIEIAPQTTLLVSHNIDLAERVPVREGDAVQIRGEYVWNNRGGVLHWTHHDPRGRQAGGWIEHQGKRYQ